MEFCKACGGAIARIGNFNVCEVCSNRWTTENVGSINTDENKRAWEVLRNCDFEKATELFLDLNVLMNEGTDKFEFDKFELYKIGDPLPKWPIEYERTRAMYIEELKKGKK